MVFGAKKASTFCALEEGENTDGVAPPPKEYDRIILTTESSLDTAVPLPIAEQPPASPTAESKQNRATFKSKSKTGLYIRERLGLHGGSTATLKLRGDDNAASDSVATGQAAEVSVGFRPLAVRSLNEDL